jgi:putative lipoprotein
MVRGTVAYRERMALPPDAEIEAWITDTSPGIQVQAVLGRATVGANGRQVPIPFEIEVDPARVAASHTYGIRAAIRSRGTTLFETPEPVPVLTQGAPSEVQLLLQRAASGAAGKPTTTVLAGTKWRLVQMDGKPALTERPATLEFVDATHVAGSGSCNRFTGAVQVTGSSIRFGPLAATRMACPGATDTQEKQYFEALQGATRFAEDGPALLVYHGESSAPLRFERQ